LNDARAAIDAGLGVVGYCGNAPLQFSSTTSILESTFAPMGGVVRPLAWATRRARVRRLRRRGATGAAGALL